jgi:hypothetical protein
MKLRRRSSIQQDQEDVSRKQFADCIEPYGWKTTDVIPDLGEDFLVRIYRKGVWTGLTLYSQLKSTLSIENYRLKSGFISYSFDVSDIEHWEAHAVPVYLIIWDITKRNGWWLSIEDAIKYLDLNSRDWRGKKQVKVHIPYENVIDENGLNRIYYKIADRFSPLIFKDKDLDIQTKFVFPQTPEGKAKLAELERTFAYGDGIELDGRFIDQFEFSDPWKRLYGDIDPKTMFLKISPIKSTEIHPVQIDFISPELGSERVPYVELRIIKQGNDEITVSNKDQSIRIKFLLRINHKSNIWNISFNFKLYDADSIDALQMLRIQKILSGGCTVRITTISTGGTDSFPVKSGLVQSPPDEIIRYIENLVFIQQRSGKILKLPDDSAFLFENVKHAEELVSIFNFGSHNETGMVVTIGIGRQDIKQISGAHKEGAPLHFRIISEESYIDLLGEHFDLGPMIQDITGKWEMPVDVVIAWLEKAEDQDFLQVRLIDVELHEEFKNWSKQ